jgi:hypothetical protein
MRLTYRFVFLCGAAFLLASVSFAGITGSISGEVTDPSGAVVVGATVTAINTQTGIRSVVQTDAAGFYNFPALAVGKYDVEVQQTGFKTFRKTGLVIDANSALRVDVKLQLGATTEEVKVMSEPVHVETQSTQLGEVIEGSKIVAVPLNGRAYTDLLSLQPGVIPAAYGRSVQSDLGSLNDRPASGDLNPGNQAVDGQRQSSNGFLVNGANVEEGKNNGAAIVPNLDSIEEFRIITSNYDAEYGNFSGGQVNVVTKSGTNQYHGSAFEFLRNTVFDARNFFDATGTVPAFKQNQFGGTFGGPVKKDKLFFFLDYQGTRKIQGQPELGQVPSLADRSGNLSDIQSSLTGLVSSPAFANVLNARLAAAGNNTNPITPNEAYVSAQCTTLSQCVFPNGIVNSALISPAAAGLLQFIPLPTPGVTINGQPGFSTSSFNQRLRDDKAGIRVDDNTRWGSLSFYYFADDFLRDDPFPNSNGAANVGASAPGFNSSTFGRAQLINISDTKSFGSSALNEFRFSFVRNAGAFFEPVGGLASTNPNDKLSALGFPAPSGTGANFNGGIAPINPKLEGVPQVTFQGLGLSIGLPQTTPRQFNNTFQWQDNFSKIIGTHSLKFGGQFHYDQINERNFFGENGAFSFANGTETGIDFADFLIGAPSAFTQASEQILDSRTKYAGLYIQDSWRAKPSLTLNYGLRWEFSQPWYDTQGKIETIVPGEQSVVFPGAPKGWVVPGDPGIPKTLAPTKYDAFSPRVGLAYSPNADSGILAKITGGPGKTSIRMGYGMYYTSVEDLSQFLEVGDPPFGLFYSSPNSPLLDTPFIDRGGTNEGQRFPFTIPSANASASNPNTTFNWPGVEPISFGFSFFHKNQLPYAEHYELSLQRQFGAGTVLSVGYVGTQGHKLATSLEANPGNGSLCLALQNLGATTPQLATCGTNSENGLSPNSFVVSPNNPTPGFVLPSTVTSQQLQQLGLSPSNSPCSQFTNTLTCQTPCIDGTSGLCQAVTSTRTFSGLGPGLAGNPLEIEMANSAYNSLQVSLRHTSGLASFLIGYTFSKSLDNSSGLQDSTNPFNFKASRSLSDFDVTHIFVASYDVRLPFEKLPGGDKGLANKVAGGWSLSGITTFATGLPVTLTTGGSDLSLTGAAVPFEEPQVVKAGKILNNTDPRSGQAYFDTTLLAPPALGQVGNANRRFFHGPGINNWDMALLKDTKITESKSLEFRFEAFNIFNHAQFGNPDGNVTSSTFGFVSGTSQDARVLQAALKFHF